MLTLADGVTVHLVQLVVFERQYFKREVVSRWDAREQTPLPGVDHSAANQHRPSGQKRKFRVPELWWRSAFLCGKIRVVGQIHYLL